MGHTQLPHYHNGSNSRREGLVDSDSPLLSLGKVIEFLPMAAYANRGFRWKKIANELNLEVGL
jgi:hypothetical protein